MKQLRNIKGIKAGLVGSVLPSGFIPAYPEQ